MGCVRRGNGGGHGGWSESRNNLLANTWYLGRIGLHLERRGVELVHFSPRSDYFRLINGVQLPTILSHHKLYGTTKALGTGWRAARVGSTSGSPLGRRVTSRELIHCLPFVCYASQYFLSKCHNLKMSLLFYDIIGTSIMKERTIWNLRNHVKLGNEVMLDKMRSHKWTLSVK